MTIVVITIEMIIQTQIPIATTTFQIRKTTTIKEILLPSKQVHETQTTATAKYTQTQTWTLTMKSEFTTNQIPNKEQ